MQIVREEKAETVNEQAPDKPPVNSAAESKLGVKSKRSNNTDLNAPSASRSRSHSRHHPVTDQGQIRKSIDDLSHPVPPLPTTTAADSSALRKTAPISPSNNEATNLLGGTTGVIVSDNPQSPATIIPATDGSSTRPFKGGIAYPFSLKVDGETGKDVNASTLTLQSMNITTPPAVDPVPQEVELGAGGATAESANKQVSNERPAVERFFTAASGAEIPSQQNRVMDSHAETPERPPVERFETAQEDLNTFASGIEKT